MVKQFSKPQEARELEARARARRCGVMVNVAVVARRYTTTSRATNEVYTIECTPAGWACTCLGYFHTGCCKHLGAVERRAECEGWDFGAVAPLH